MGKALYRKYRSKSLDEIVGQEHITHTLQQALKQDRISHAYLFTGPRGVGKTSIARILAHEINQLPYTDDSTHIDIIEIDAASNRRIDEIRDLRDKVSIAPTSAKYKVYIIDEVHMLTREAFNALLKTLEEPPEHVVFILATTDAHKLPATIVSRTQRFTFKPVATEAVVAHLQHIAKEEQVTVSDDALRLLAQHGEGSFRDSISLLDQARSHSQKLDIGDIQTLLGIPPEEAITQLAASLWHQGAADIISQLEALYAQGFQGAAIAKQLGSQLRSQLVTNQLEAESALPVLMQLLQVPSSFDPERALELVLLQTAVYDTPSRPTEPRPTATPTPPKPDKQEPSATVKKQASEPPVVRDEISEASETPKVNGTATFDAALWPQVLQALKQRHNTLYGVVRMAEPDFSTQGSVTLAFSFAFHQKRINEQANRQLLSSIIQELTGEVVLVECIVQASAVPPKVAVPAQQKAPAKDLSTISNIFGGGELLES